VNSAIAGLLLEDLSALVAWYIVLKEPSLSEPLGCRCRG